jgi:hypothetical protein
MKKIIMSSLVVSAMSFGAAKVETFEHYSNVFHGLVVAGRLKDLPKAYEALVPLAPQPALPFSRYQRTYVRQQCARDADLLRLIAKEKPMETDLLCKMFPKEGQIVQAIRSQNWNFLQNEANRVTNRKLNAPFVRIYDPAREASPIKTQEILDGSVRSLSRSSHFVEERRDGLIASVVQLAPFAAGLPDEDILKCFKDVSKEEYKRCAQMVISSDTFDNEQKKDILELLDRIQDLKHKELVKAALRVQQRAGRSDVVTWWNNTTSPDDLLSGFDFKL